MSPDRQDALPSSASRDAPAAPALASVLRDALVLLLLTAALWLLHIFGRILPTAALVAIWAALALAIATGLFRRARVRRRAWLEAYVVRSSPLSRSLRGGGLMAAHQTVLAAALALLLIVAVIRLDDRAAWIVLLAGVPFVVLLRRLLGRAFRPHASPEYLRELAWRWTVGIAGTALAAALVTLSFQRAYPDFAGIGLERAVWHLVDQERARSEWAEILLQMAAAKDALRLWLAQQLMPQPGTSFAQAMGWLLVLAEEGLVAWSYLSLSSAALIWMEPDEPRRDEAD